MYTLSSRNIFTMIYYNLHQMTYLMIILSRYFVIFIGLINFAQESQGLICVFPLHAAFLRRISEIKMK